MLKKKLHTPTPLEEAIVSAHDDLKSYDADSKEYDTILKQIVVLNGLLPTSKEKRKPIDPNTLILGGVNLLGIVAILKFEQAAPLVSKALGFVKKI